MKSKEFGKYLQELRKARRLTLLDVEAEAKISNGYLSQLETGVRGIPHFDTLKKLAAVYKVSVSEMMAKAESASHGKEIGKAETELDAVARDFQRLSDTEKEQLKTFLKYLLEKDKSKRGRK